MREEGSASSSGGDYTAYDADGAEVTEQAAGAPASLATDFASATRARPASAPHPPTRGELSGAKALAEPAGAPQTPTPPSSSGATAQLDRPVERRPMLIYDARVHLAVFEADRALDAAEAVARDAGGYLVHRSDREITFRVPAAAFESALQAAMKLGDVLHREVSVRDVTEELMDLHVRLRNGEAVRDRLQQLLARATSVKEALEVETELERVTREIEQLKGRLALLQELLAYSTITLQFEPRPVEQIDPQVRLPFPWLEQLKLTELLRL